MGAFALGSLRETIQINKYDGFDRPNTAQLVSILSDGSSVAVQVLQEGAVPLRLALVAGRTMDPADIEYMRDLYTTRAAVPFTDCDGLDFAVRIFDMTTSRGIIGQRFFNLTLIEADDAVEGPGMGAPITGLSTTLAADPAIAATNLKVASVTTVAPNGFVRVSPSVATEANSEVVRVLAVGTTGSGGTGLDISSDTGDGMVLNHASGATVKTVRGTYLSMPSLVGATNLKVDSVTGLAQGTRVRIGYLGHYETRVLTVVGTAGRSGTGISFTGRLAHAHSLNEWVIAVV